MSLFLYSPAFPAAVYQYCSQRFQPPATYRHHRLYLIPFAVYLLLFFVPNFRMRWRTGVLYFGLGLVTFLLLLNAISEWFFWQEFSTRYNFIAVDYLVYTTEVLGNIMESYPIAWIMTALVLTAIGIVFMSRSLVRSCVHQSLSLVNAPCLQ